MRRIERLAVAIVLGAVTVAGAPTPALAHQLELTPAEFTGTALVVGGNVVHDVGDPIHHFGVEAYDGTFRFEGTRGRPVSGKLVNALAVRTGWINHGDGTCTHWQDVWEAQSEFWAENGSGRSVTFDDPYTGSMDVVLVMHGFRHAWEGLEYSPAGDTCLWEERDSDRRDHLGEVAFEIMTSWESVVTSTGKGKKNKGQEVSTTVRFETLRFGGAPIDILESDDPPSPYAFSGPARYEVGVLTFADAH